MKEQRRVLFLFTYSAARGQMTEARLRHSAGDRLEACQNEGPLKTCLTEALVLGRG